jgi:hypothetical protein
MVERGDRVDVESFRERDQLTPLAGLGATDTQLCDAPPARRREHLRASDSGAAAAGGPD